MTLNFDDIFDLLESVREYKRQPKERLQPTGSVTGTFIGYASDHLAMNVAVKVGAA